MSTKKKRVERLHAHLSWVAGVVAFGCFAFCGSKWEFAYAGAEEAMNFLGLSFVAIAVCGRLWCMLYMAENKTKTFVTEGPYSLCRNPLYLFSIVGSIGMGLGSSTFTAPLVFIVVFSLYYPFTVKEEENRLLLIHGQDYRDYCAKTPRYIPSFKNFHEPEKCELNPRIFRRYVGNAVLWVSLFGCWDIFEFLRFEKWIPTLFNVW